MHPRRHYNKPKVILTCQKCTQDDIKVTPKSSQGVPKAPPYHKNCMFQHQPQQICIFQHRPKIQIVSPLNTKLIEGPLGRATPPPFYICFGTQGADWRKAACDAKLATAGGRHLAEMHTTYPVLNRSRENTPWSRGPPRRQRTLQRKKSRCRGGQFALIFAEYG